MPVALGDERGEAALVREFHLAPLLLKLGIVGERFELAQSVEILQPAVADARGDQLRQSRIAQGDKTPRRHAIGDIAKFLRPKLREIAQHRLLEQLGVKLRDAVDGVAADLARCAMRT